MFSLCDQESEKVSRILMFFDTRAAIIKQASEIRRKFGIQIIKTSRNKVNEIITTWSKFKRRAFNKKLVEKTGGIRQLQILQAFNKLSIQKTRKEVALLRPIKV